MKRFSLTLGVSLVLAACASPGTTGAPAAAAPGAGLSLDQLLEGATVHGFRTEALYVDAEERPIGARFVHGRTGFTLDLLQIESVPQGFIWVNSYPTSDMGEPHTQEHLLLGKGNRGRFVADLENMSLAVSSAFVQQWRTAYHFHTSAGPEVFYNLFEQQMGALLDPDYTDEEIRREVRNFGVTVNPDGTLRLEEKGTVYNEMVSSFERPFSLPYRALQQAIYGAEHPLSYSAGGFPAAIREMQPEHIRQFHRENYQLGNMGMVGAYPREMPLHEVLSRTDAILNRLQGDRPVQRDFMREERLPRPRMAPAGTIEVVEYPHQNPQQPSALMFGWPAQLELDSREQALLDLFVANLAGDATTNLYRIFVDTRTREMEIGARSISSWTSSDLGRPFFVILNDIPPAQLTEARVREVRERILQEIRGIAALPDGSPELAEFNARIRNRLIEEQRRLSNFVNSPPGFGQRGTGSTWATHLHQLNQEEGFRKSLVMEPEREFIASLLDGGTNFWRDYLRRWRLDETEPYAVASRPSPELIQREQAERRARTEAELRRLAAHYGTTDEQETIRRYQADYDAETARLDAIAAEATKPRFIDAPPLTLDPRLDYRVERIGGGIPVVASTFDNMTSATVGLALRLDAVPERELLYLAIMPTLLTQTGVVRDGTPIPFTHMREALRQEILGLNAYFTANLRTGRNELVVRGAGNTLEESQRAVEWMREVLYHPDWRPENLARIRDVVDQQLAGLRNTTQRSEEAWVNDPANAYRRQDDPLFLSTQSFLTRTHHVHRLRWLLQEAPAGAEGQATLAYLERLGAAGAQGSRAELRALLGAIAGDAARAAEVTAALQPYLRTFQQLPAGARPVIVEAAKDLELTLAEVPDASLAADWRYLTGQIRADLMVPPAQALAGMDAVRQRILNAGGARIFVVGSRASQQALQPGIAALTGGLAAAPAQRASYAATPLVDTRLRARAPEAADPLFVGLLNPNTQGGVFLNSAPLASYADTDREALLDFLAAKLYAGGGAHSIFMKTWGAGLAYSNGLRSSPASGRLTYYAERVPELPQTLRFVIEELRAAPRDPAVVEYAIAQAFGELRGAHTYESRGEAMAADLADGQTPEQVRAFREAILALRDDPTLVDAVYDRMERVYGRVLPGHGPASRQVEDGIFFVIGPEPQLRLYEEYLRTAEAPAARLHRLYPRDFWMTAAPAAASAQREE